MTLQQLEYVVAVYRFKHFTKAAEYCDVTQPTLSSMIQKLEEELGVTIFDRKKNPVQVTSVGMEIIDQAWKVLTRARKLKEIVDEDRHSLHGTFHVGVLPTIAPYLIPRFLPQLMSSHPDMDIRMIEMKTEQIRKALIHGDIDAGILARVDNLEDFSINSLFYEQYFAYVAKADRLYDRPNIRIADLTGEYLWLLDEGHCFRDQLVKYCHLKAASQSKKAYSLGSIETFMRIVESGKGVTFIPELALLQLSNEQKQLVKPFALPVPTREIVMMTSKGFIRNTLLQLLIDEIRQSVPPEMLRLRVTQQKI
jgi:LysR family hydrogen peroxide-inducible transcriptional activator